MDTLKNLKEIICPSCKNIITKPETVRCPRCFAALLPPGCQGSCTKCLIKEKCSS